MSETEKNKNLTFIDIVILAIIFFGIPIWQSVSMYLTSSSGSGSVSFDVNTITDQMQWMSIAQEIALLGIAALYLWLRRFDFRSLQFNWNRWTLPLIAGLIIAGATASDLGMWGTQAIFPETTANVGNQINSPVDKTTYDAYLKQAQEYIDTYDEQILDSTSFVSQGYAAKDYAAYLQKCQDDIAQYKIQLEEWKENYEANAAGKETDEPVAQNMSSLPKITFMTVLFALLNGFFEEVFFMGLVFACNRKSLPWALIFSTLVRFSFHTYQGFPAAVGITCMGLVFMLARKKIRSLVPFTLAHSFFDVFGVTLWFWIYQLIY